MTHTALVLNSDCSRQQSIAQLLLLLLLKKPSSPSHSHHRQHQLPRAILQRSDTCYSASYISHTRDQKRFTVSEVAADWHELMIPQRTMRPSIARVSEQLDPRFAASRHTTALISHTRPSVHPVARKLLLISRPAEGRRLS